MQIHQCKANKIVIDVSEEYYNQEKKRNRDIAEGHSALTKNKNTT